MGTGTVLAFRQKALQKTADGVANPDMTEEQKMQQRAFGEDIAQQMYSKSRKARAVVSVRLAMSLAEVERALEKCPDVKYEN